MPKTAVILAAGEGKRLLPLTYSVPKTLVDVNGVSILENALQAFHDVNIELVRIVVGHLSNVIKNYFGDNYKGMTLEYITNNDFAVTNSMYSLHLGLKGLAGVTWVLEGDVFFDPTILNLGAGDDLLWYADSSMRDVDGAYLFCGKGSKAESLEIVRDLSLLKLGHCKSIGILKLSSNGVNLLQKWLSTGINEGKKNLYYDLIIEEHLRKQAVYIIDVKGYKWFEIDTPQDLERARSLFK